MKMGTGWVSSWLGGRSFPWQTQPQLLWEVAVVIQVVLLFPVPVSVLLYFSPQVPCYCMDTSMLRSPQLGSHSVNCPVAQAVWWGEGMRDHFQRRSKDHNQCPHICSTGQAVHWQLLCFPLQCLRWPKEDILERKELIRELIIITSQGSTFSIHNFTQMFLKLFASWVP